MSQERPLLHNNIGGFVTTSTTTTTPAPAPAVPSSTTSCVEPSNMVLSAIPLDGHVIIQQAPVPRSAATLTNNYTQIHRGSPSNLITTGSHHHPVTKTTMISGGAPSPSKYVFFQHNGNGQYTTNEAFITTASQQSNNVGGNIVLVATEQMEMGHTENVIASNGTAPGDEELTSLTWLHDKNLIKDIVSCSNGIKSTTTTTTITGQNQQLTNNGNLITGITKGPISPATSDCPDESCASDDNVSLNNLNMDHGINVHHHTGQNDYIQHQHHQIQYTNNNSIIKNRNHIVSPPHASFASTPPLLHENLQAMGATTTVHVGPSGTTTVVEYKTNSNFVPSARHLQSNINTNTTLNNNCQTLHNLNQNSNQNQSVPQSPLRNNNTVVVTSSSIAGGVVPSVASIPSVASVLSQAQTSVTITSTTNTSPTTTTHHPHKKYLQQMNGFDHGGGGGGGAGVSASSNSGSGTSIKVTTNTNGQYNNNNNNNININNNNSNNNNNNNNNNNDNNTSQSSLPSSPSYSTTYTIPLNQQQTTLTTEVKEQSSCNQNQLINSSQYQHSLLKTPPSYSPNGYETDSLKDYEISSNGGRSSSGAGSITNVNAQKGSPSPKQKHPTNVPYDPLIHTHNKPPYSFSSLIFMAIEDSPEKALPVKEIYAWIVEHFPYFRTAPTGWKNSVRHNLSLNKSFVKVEKAPNMGKGSLWRVEQQQRPNLIHALTRSPFFPCSAVDKISQQNRSSEASSPRGQCSSPPMTPVKSNFDAWLFPKLSKTLKDMVQSNGNGGGSPNETASNDSHTIYALTTNSNGTYTSTPISSYQSIEHLARDCGADSIDDVNAATAMLALKHGPKVFNETFQNGSPVITSSPSEDHTYSAGGSGSGGNSNASTTNSINGNANVSNQTQHNGSDNLSTCASSDAAYESSEESHNISAEQLEEQQRQRDGVDALLSLSSVFDISPIKRRSSTTVEEEHTSSYMENIPHLHGMGSIAIANGGSTTTTSNTNNNHTTVILDEGYNTQSYYSHLVTPTPPKKMKPLRSLRAKIKRKTAWIR